MSKQFTIGTKVLNLSDLEASSASDLAKVYNEAASLLGEKAVNRFADKPTALKRTLALLERAVVQTAITSTAPQKPAAKLPPQRKAKPEEIDEAEPQPVVKQPKQKAKQKAKPQTEATERRGRQPSFNFPATDDAREPAPNTNRRIVFDMLARKEGATFDEVLAETWGRNRKMDEKTQRHTTYEAIRLLHSYLGWGMRQNDEGRIFLVRPKKG